LAAAASAALLAAKKNRAACNKLPGSQGDSLLCFQWRAQLGAIGFRDYTSPHNSAALLPIFKRVRSVETPVEFLLERRLARNGRQRDVALQKSRATA
jgi:hypothetical protein